MAKLDAKGILAAVEVAFYFPALLLFLFVLVRGKFSRLLGWIYLMILCILRIIGDGATVYSDVKNDDSKTLLETAAITSAIGLAPLLNSLMGFLKSMNATMRKGSALPAALFHAVQLVSLIALVLSIIGYLDRFKDLDPNSSKAMTGRKFAEVSAALFVIVYVAVVATIAIIFMRKDAVSNAEHKLLYACIVALPFLLIRVIYSVLVAVAKNATDAFYFDDVSVWALAFMVFLMEGIIILLFLVAGILTPKGKSIPNRENGGIFNS